MNSTFDKRLSALGFDKADVEERFVIGAGRGGQKIQKTSSCVWLRHKPTGTEVRCQRERSQTLNRMLAWTELCEKLERRVHEQVEQRKTEAEKARRRRRQKSRGQKLRMVRSKKHRSRIKAGRGAVESE